MEENIMKQYIYGKNTVYDAINSDIKVHEVLLASRDEKIIETLVAKNIKYRFISKSDLNKFGKVNHQGIVAQVEEYKYCQLEDILKSNNSDNNIVVVLDQIEDPHNFGAILRTCDAAGVKGVIIQDKRQVGVTPTVAKVSTGAVNHIKIARVTNIVRAMEKLQEANYWIVGTDAKNATDYRKINYQGNIAIVIGSEGKGIRDLVLKKCDLKAYIPMSGTVTSLNASVAAALLIYEARNGQNPVE